MHGVIGNFNQSSVTKRLVSGRIARRLALILGALTITSGALWYGEYWWTTARFMESTDDAYVGGNVTPIRRGFLQVLEASSPELHADVERGTLIGRLRGFGGAPGYLRQCHGAGWALVGDAGYFKDPLTAHGITDAFR